MKTVLYTTWIEIQKKALLHNYRLFRRHLQPTVRYMAVVKSNAYGHGMIETARILDAAGADWFGVDSLDEAIELRKTSIKKPLLVFGYTPVQRISEAVKYDITITIANIDAIHDITKQRNVPKFHLKIDTGMHRQGFTKDELTNAFHILKQHRIQPTGIYTHFSSAGDPAKSGITRMQIQLFKHAVHMAESAGFQKLIKHAAATAGCVAFPQSHFDMVRIGIGGYGLWPSAAMQKTYKKMFPLQPVLVWKTIVSQIKRVKTNDAVGYNRTEKVHRPTSIAILPIGYWHGLPRSLSSIGHVLIHGQKAKILGRISMDMISVDITDIPNTKREDEAVIIGKDMPAEELADSAHTINYEIVTRINTNIPRLFR